MKTLYIITKGMGKPSTQKIAELEKNNEMPRQTYLEDLLRAEVLDERYLEKKTPAIRNFIYRFLPVHICQFFEALFIHHKYDVILSQAENAGLPLALVMKYFRMKTPHIIILSRITSVNAKKGRLKMWFVSKVKDTASMFLIWSSNQRKIAIEKLGVDPSKIALIKRGTDEKFWKPQPSETDMICSVGMEARDYPTLVEALRPLDIPCHIAAGEARGVLFDTVKKLYQIKDLPENITVGERKYADLRELYAKCRFVIVPLLPTDSDNGLTTILESMAMGKPVICTRTEGQIDVIQDGKTGIFIPRGNPSAMRDAIEELWNDPERCKKMGNAARAFIEQNHNLEQFAFDIKKRVTDVVNKERTRESHHKEYINIGIRD